uniref:GTPase-activating protein skywalker-like n=1 Tax=Actinia tenebrosa TaxID=6105 RepID=A0A6P8IVQ8_ACTTE
MELNDLDVFSKWVSKDTDKKGYDRTTKVQNNEEAFVSAFRKWAERPNMLETKLKKMVRQGVPPKCRADLWRVGSGGDTKLQKHPNYFQETINEMGIQIPSQLPDNMFDSQQTSPNYYLLSPSGRKKLLDILYVMTQVHPDIQFCPLLPSIAALFLHIMDEDGCYCCLAAMLEENRVPFFDQSQRAVAAMAKTFQDCLKQFMKSSYVQLKMVVSASSEVEVTKATILFPHWLTWLFKYLNIWTLVYTVDNFMIQGPKVIVRVGLVVFDKFSKWLAFKQITSGDIEALFSHFMKELPLKDYRLLEAAFKIRGLAKKKLTKLKNKNLQLLDDGKLEVPFDTAPVKITTLYSIQGSDMLSATQWEKLASWLPEKIQIRHPFCLFSTQTDGCSIRTLYNKCENETETIMLIKTSKGEIFGAYCSTSWSERNEAPKSLTYFGTGEMFVFSLYPTPIKYCWNGLEEDGENINEYFMAGDNNCLMIGGGGDNAIWLDAELSHGHSGSSKTFRNHPLASGKDFDCVRVEVLAFES